MTGHQCDYLLWTATTRDTGAAGGLAYTFQDVETQAEQMVEAVLTESVAEPSIVPQMCGGAGSPVTLSVVIPMFNRARGIGRLFGALEESLALAGCMYEIICVDDGSGTRRWRGCSQIANGTGDKDYQPVTQFR
jgi:glycosyl transferase family 2